jgi:endonuclease/exonuclease/phosphatase family metal-dependent hydrolase
MALLGCIAPAAERGDSPELRVMAWNIWHGGREDGKDVGPARVAEVIRGSGADVVAMQETYGSGPMIATDLGFHFHPRGTNVSIHSRYPVLEDISVHKAFGCVGALIELPDKSCLAFYSIWLPYSAEIWAAGTRNTDDPDAMRAACAASAESLAAIWNAIEQRLAGPQYADVPIIIAGDFNSMSHLDYGEIGRDQYGMVVDWPTSLVLTQAGFVDTYRACTRQIRRDVDWTWSPRFLEQEQDRIDFIYARAPGWMPVGSKVVRDHPVKFPSDHAAVLTTMRRSTSDTAAMQKLRAVTYNIKHGAGMDRTVSLDRSANVLRGLAPDFIGLQEVDLGATRSGGSNQANDLAQQLDMHPAFGSFMPFQGGHYGMAILSRFPIINVHSLRLPTGNEPRIALIVEARLPGGATVLVVNVHFDWVKDDDFRFHQATMLADYLQELSQPYILLGDFNDIPDSRTLRLFREIAIQALKPVDDRLTFPSTTPQRELDFIFASPAQAWQVGTAAVVNERLASDHRPVVVDLVFRGQ